MKLGKETGSFFNHLMSRDVTPPVVGKGATKFMWSDRHAYDVLAVDEKDKSCLIRRSKAERTDNLGMSDIQNYKYSTDEEAVAIRLIYRRGAWREDRKTIVFTDEFSGNFNLTKEQELAVYGDPDSEEYTCYPINVVEGITRIKKSYPKFNIAFGYQAEYYDYTF